MKHLTVALMASLLGMGQVGAAHAPTADVSFVPEAPLAGTQVELRVRLEGTYDIEAFQVETSPEGIRFIALGDYAMAPRDGFSTWTTTFPAPGAGTYPFRLELWSGHTGLLIGTLATGMLTVAPQAAISPRSVPSGSDAGTAFHILLVVAGAGLWLSGKRVRV